MKPNPKSRSRITRLAAVVAGAALLLPPAARAEEPKFRIGVVTFLSGAAAGPFGVPARNGAEVLAEAINGGKLPAPYAKPGIGGRPIELVFLDEAGGTTKQVSEFRDLVQRQKVDAVIGYISSGDCLAVAPVAEELKALTIFFDCGTPRIFEDAAYKYVFRTSSHAAMDNVAAALYVTEMMPKAKKIAGINQNYAWGQDSWNDFEASMKVLRPGVTVTTSQMPKLLAGQYGAEISALMAGSPDVIHSSFWGGDLDAFVLQAVPRGALKKSTAVLTCGETATHKLGSQIPDGTMIGARGPHGAYAPDNELNRFFRAAYQDRFVALAQLPRLPHVPVPPRPQGRLREGPGCRRRRAHPGPGHRRLREAHLRDAERHHPDVARQGAPGGGGDGLRPGQDGEGQAHVREREAVPGREGQSSGGREERRLDQGGLQGPEVAPSTG